MNVLVRFEECSGVGGWEDEISRKVIKGRGQEIIRHPHLTAGGVPGVSFGEAT